MKMLAPKTLVILLLFISCSKDKDNTNDATQGSTAEERKWTYTRDFNSGTLGEKVGFDAGGLSVYDDEQAFEGGQSCRMGIRETDEGGFGQWGGIIHHPETLKLGDELWMRIRIYFPDGFQYYATDGGGRLKFLRFHTESGYNDIYIDQEGSETPFRYIYEGKQVWSRIGEQKDLPEYDVWETYEFYVRFDTKAEDDGGKAVVRFWKNGTLLKEITDLNTLKLTDNTIDRTHIFTYWNGENPPTQHLWVDDIVLTSDVPGDKDELGNPYIGMN